jgi:hypothetical protein
VNDGIEDRLSPAMPLDSSEARLSDAHTPGE